MGYYKYNRIKAVLVDINKSEADLAKMLGVSTQTVSNWCVNRIQPSLPRFLEISKVLKVEYFMLFENPPKYVSSD